MIAQLLDYWNQYTIVVSICVFLFCFQWIRPKFGVLPAMLFGCCAYSSIWCWLFVQNRYLPVDPYNQMALRYFSADSIAKIMLICMPLMALSENRMRMLFLGEVGISIFVVGSCLLSIYESLRYGCGINQCGGFIGNPSISMGLMACMLPVFIKSWKRQWFLILLAAITIFISKSSVALGLLAAYVGMWLFPWKMFKEFFFAGRKYNFVKLFPALVSVIVIMGIGRLSLGSEFTNDSDRFRIWNFMLERWSAPHNLLFGTGLGTYHVFSINLQQIKKFDGVIPYGWWNTMHNDFLQQLFECGIVGFFLLFATYCSALFKLIKECDWQIALSAFLFGLYACLDPALHNPLPILFGAWLFIYALRKPNKEYL